MTDVAAAIIIDGTDDPKVLVAQRAQGEKFPGRWEFPGGKLEPGETIPQCLVREIQEELDAEVEVLQYFDESIYTYETGAIRLVAYLCRWISGEFSLRVHSRLEWADAGELATFDFLPADIPIVEKLVEFLARR